ncbi:MAG: aspartate aminotransferase family protein [Bacteroidales bacterium]|jgi:acetylornithine/succinyldiaminopimelate/putrescine aminotransferase|nr:aspartate aminotransferase family protein [Bacteroidales bacterium]
MNLRELFYRYVAQTSPEPLAIEIERAEGIYLYTPEGKSYMDIISGISVSNVGHCNPEVVKAIHNQAEKYMHLLVYGEMIQTPQVKLAQRLASLLPENLSSVYFVNSGAEAIEGAIKLAKRFTHKTGLASCENAYHGSTCGAMSLMGNDDFVQAFQPLLPECCRIRFGVEEDLEKITTETAAFVVEVVQGEAGVRYADKKYWKKVRERCDETNTLLVFDEIQTGFGRTGTMFAFEQTGVVPDIITLAKAMGGGMPVGAFIASKEIMSALTFNPVLGHMTTFGGHPLCCAAALASVDIIERDKLYKTAEEKGKLFELQLANLPQVKTFRRKGLMIALDFNSRAFNFHVIHKCLENGILSDWFLFCDAAMRISPPLIITKEEIKEVCRVIKEIILSADITDNKETA